MSYIGRGTENISNVEVLDNLTFDGSASYTLQKSSVNFVPSSANNLLISISGVVQQGNFSVSGSTITFDTTVSGSDTCDWILHYGTGLITTVADGAITETKLGSNAVTTAKINDSAVTYAKTDGNFGKIGQVINSKFTSTFSTTSTSFVTTGHSASITPTSTSSKILIFLNGGSSWNNNDVNYNRWTTIYRGATDLGAGTVGLQNMYANTLFGGVHSINYLDSPASTSSTTYTVYHRTQGGTSWYTHDAGTGTATPVNLTLMEVLA